MLQAAVLAAATVQRQRSLLAEAAVQIPLHTRHRKPAAAKQTVNAPISELRAAGLARSLQSKLGYRCALLTWQVRKSFAR